MKRRMVGEPVGLQRARAHAAGEALRAVSAARSDAETLENAGRCGGRVELARDHLVEQRVEALVLLKRLLELAPQAVRRQPDDLADEVAPPALGQQPLGLDVGAVLIEALEQ